MHSAKGGSEMSLVEGTGNYLGGNNPKAETPRDDVWIHTSCDMCYSGCGVKVHRVNGVVVNVEGDPNCPLNSGTLCAKGHAMIMAL